MLEQLISNVLTPLLGSIKEQEVQYMPSRIINLMHRVLGKLGLIIKSSTFTDIYP